MVRLKCKECRQGHLKLIKEIKNEEVYVAVLNEKKMTNRKIYKCQNCGKEDHNITILETGTGTS
jgi:uncharacterized protein with PIN domain